MAYMLHKTGRRPCPDLEHGSPWATHCFETSLGRRKCGQFRLYSLESVSVAEQLENLARALQIASPFFLLAQLDAEAPILDVHLGFLPRGRLQAGAEPQGHFEEDEPVLIV